MKNAVKQEWDALDEVQIEYLVITMASSQGSHNVKIVRSRY